MSAERQAKVGIKLTVDDRASRAADKIKGSFSGVKDKVEGATTSMRRFAAYAVAAGAALTGVRGVSGFARAIVQSAEGANQAQRRIGAMLSAVTGANYAMALRGARSVHNQLEQIGIAAGVSADSVTRAYEEMFGVMSRAGGGGQMMGVMESLTRISGALNIPMEQMSQSVIGIQSGMVRARDPLVQMLRSFAGLDVTTDKFKKMTEPQRLAALQGAFASVADKVRGVPPGFTQLVQSLRDIKDNLLEAVGAPVVEKLTQMLSKVRDSFAKNGEDIEYAAHRWGVRIAEFVEHAAQVASKTFHWVSKNWDRIVYHAQRMPLYLGAGMAGRAALGGAASLASQGVGLAGQGLMGLMMRPGGAAVERSAAATVAGGAMRAGGVVAHFGEVLPAFTTRGPYGMRAAPALDVAALGGGTGILSRIGAVAGSGGGAGLIAVAGALAAVAAVAAVVAGAAYAFSRNLGGLGVTFRRVTGSLWVELRKLWVVAQPLVEKLAEVSGQAIVGLIIGLGKLANAFTWLLNTMLSNPLTQLLLMHLGVSPAATATRNRSEDADAAARQQAEWQIQQIMARDAQMQLEALMGNTSGPPTIDARGSHFEIKQDFRDEDPDRIAAIFTRDIARAAGARVHARTSVPFGP